MNILQAPSKIASAARLAVSLTATLALAATLAGCSNSALTGNFGVGDPAPTIRFSGNVHGGQQAVSLSTIQLYGVSTTLKGASTALIGTSVLSDGNGNFNITGKYSCSGISKVYITATGGNPGAGTNANLAMATAIGDCATLQANAANTFITINEVTTVAAAYALAPMAADGTHIGSANAAAVTNAFNTANELAASTTGVAGGPMLPTGAKAPVTQTNTLGNIIASCVNTTGAGSMQCSQLFTATGATNTFDAALAIARNPGASAITALYTLSPGTAPFQPSNTGQVNDYTLPVTYVAASGLSSPFGIALDASGNAWVTNEGAANVTELSPNGAVVATVTATNLFAPQGIAIDKTGSVWVANTAGNSVIKFGLTGGAVTSTSIFTTGGVQAPTAIALDSAGNAFVSNFNGNSVTGLTNAGVALGGSPFTAGGAITVPGSIAVDPSGNVLVSSGSGSIVKLSNAGALVATLTDGTLTGPLGVAVSSANNVFATGNTSGATPTGAVAEFANTTASTVSPVTTGVATPFGVATDGTFAYVANSVAAGSLAKLQYGTATPVSPTTGYGYNAVYDGTSTKIVNTPTGVAVDASGNVWVANTGNNTVSKFVGLAAPVTTPILYNVGP